MKTKTVEELFAEYPEWALLMEGKHPMQKRQIDICDTCHVSAYVDEGQADYPPMEDPELAKIMPFGCRFTCASCVSKRDGKAN